MKNQCRCTHATHKGTCTNTATWRCPTCGVALCSLCAIPTTHGGHHHSGHTSPTNPYTVAA